MPEKNLSTRSAYWDNVKGILIFLVVLGHYLIAYYNSEKLNLAGVIVAVIYTFHMPAFIFVSGFFSRSENSAKPKALIKLAVAYVIFNFSIMGFAFLFSGVRLS
ncbi:MAG: acyltransferase family protein, partial [Eubacteriales bacterium]